MHPALKLTDTEDLRIQPDNLLKHLESSLANFENLLSELKCTPNDLHQTLNDPKTNELLKLKTQLATLQLKLLAIRYIPLAFNKLIELMNTSEKPEVARRAANTVLNIAGIATNTKAEEPTAPTPKARQEKENQEPPEPTPEEQELFKSLAAMMRLKAHGFDLDDLPKEKIPDLIDFLTNYPGGDNTEIPPADVDQPQPPTP